MVPLCEISPLYKNDGERGYQSNCTFLSSVHSILRVIVSGAIVISLIIIYRWFAMMGEQVRKVVGYTAPPEFIQQVRAVGDPVTMTGLWEGGG